ncbi:Phage terminase large subunit (GpA) [Desulfitobacterium hafniense]|uniref:Phage terminase large subunit (GpA) n=1 Tax=Desulfitobacterium hafniense TaxID=49338 RepID=A0A098AXC7_DESHA|nr:phage terminase large subunit family protein [Desulfitobacterium hafniense]CDX01289.1 Phage terminase large subunit (GpA) [Desulfitobacterium hafniense]
MSRKSRRKTANLFKRIAKIVAPPPLLTVSEWADRYRKLSREASAEPGQWRTDRAPYQREIMDSINLPWVETIIIMSSAQVGKSEILFNAIGYFIDYDPAPIMMVQPTIDMAEAVSKDRIAPMIRDTPTLKEKIGDAKSRDSGNTLLHKAFPGGHLTLAGANSPAGLASRPIRILLADEVDRFPLSAGAEGDPLNLAAKRTTTFHNRKKVYVSTPTVKGVSRIEAEYEDSTMEQYCYECPHCGHFQPLAWAQIRFEDVTMECRACKERYSEFEWKRQPAKWIARKEHPNKRGFHLNELYSPWKRWEQVIADFEEAKMKGPEALKVWVNTSLGETWEEQGETADEDSLIKRREHYNCELPDGVLVLTAGVDVQDDRLEVEVVGWGKGKESWGIEYKIFYGDPGQNAVWNQLDDYLSRQWSYADGSGLQLSCTCVDSGGHFTTEVYKFTKPREQRRIFAIKGKGGDGVPFIGKATRNNRQKAALFSIGVDSGKDTVLTRLKEEFEGNPGYCHFPIEQEKGYDEDYFKGLTSEKRIIRYYKGRPKFEWIKKSRVRNEPLDLRNYATAALEIFNPNLEMLAEQRKNASVYVQKEVRKPVQGTKKRRVISKGVQ